MLNRTTKGIREVFYPNREATKTLHTLIPDYKEYRICKVYLEIPVLYIDIPDFCPTYVELTNAEKTNVHCLKGCLVIRWMIIMCCTL